jgi:hypothetical protein
MSFDVYMAIRGRRDSFVSYPAANGVAWKCAVDKTAVIILQG